MQVRDLSKQDDSVATTSGHTEPQSQKRQKHIEIAEFCIEVKLRSQSKAMINDPVSDDTQEERLGIF